MQEVANTPDIGISELAVRKQISKERSKEEQCRVGLCLTEETAMLITGGRVKPARRTEIFSRK